MREKEKEYQSVILGALLHDVGKFKWKQFLPQETKDREHPWFSEEFIDKELRYLEKKDWVDFELVKLLAKHHHEIPLGGKAEYDVKKIEDPNKRFLAFIVSRADSASSRERFNYNVASEKGATRYSRQYPMDSIFSEVSLQEKSFLKEKLYCYNKIEPISPHIAFPEKLDKKVQIETKTYEEHYEKFLNEIRGIEHTSATFNQFYISILSLLEKYCWCVASAADQKLTDISLYDHLKTTSAFSACIYQYYLENDDFKEKTLRAESDPYKTYKFTLLGGDLSGIQNYIYQLKGTKNRAKRLRARSFYITTILESIVHWILNRYSLPISCCLTNSGGKFLLALPNTEHVNNSLDNLSEDINDKLYEKFFGEVTLNMAWKDEKTFLANEHGFKVYDFFKHAEKIYDQLEKERYKKFNNILRKDNAWDGDKFYIDKNIWDGYKKSKKACQVCSKFPADLELKNKKEDDPDECSNCNQDKVTGTHLPNTEFISFGREKINEKSFIAFADIYVTLWRKEDGLSWKKYNEKFYMLKALYRDNKAGKSKNDLFAGTTHAFLANHIPIVEATDLKKLKRLETEGDEDKAEEGKPYTFSNLSKLSMKEEKEDKLAGSQLLGVLKADIDRLGLIFSRGFKGLIEKKNTGNLEVGDRVTPSRYLTMSRMIELFFSGWVHGKLSDSYGVGIEKDYSKIYTVYSGGDDLLLIGPWETIIYFADELYKNFRKFTCENEDITLSAGIAIVKPKTPVSQWAHLANELLECSKEQGRDRLTLFDTTIKWDALGSLINAMETLDKNMKRSDNADPLVTKAFLHRLLGYFRRYKNVNEDVSNVIYHSSMAYDIKRNIVNKYLGSFKGEEGKRQKDYFNKHKKFKDDEINKDVNRLYEVLMSAFNLCDGKVENRLMENLNIPVIWTLYKNRG